VRLSASSTDRALLSTNIFISVSGIFVRDRVKYAFNISCTVECIRCRGKDFAEQLPSNDMRRLMGKGENYILSRSGGSGAMLHKV
jgi:hypothetical protein